MQFKNLRGIREDKDIKQKDIAKYLNVSQNTYSQYETGVISLTAEVLIKLADYYNVSVDYLLDRTDNPNFQKEKPSKNTAFFIIYNKLSLLCLNHSIKKVTSQRGAFCLIRGEATPNLLPITSYLLLPKNPVKILVEVRVKM